MRIVDPGLFQRAIADSFPLTPDRLDLARSRLEIVELAGLLAEPVGTDTPRRHQHMRVVIPLVAMPVGSVDRKVDRDAVPIDQTRGKFAHGADSLLVGELVRQCQDDVPARCRTAPSSRFILGAFGGVPQLGAILCPFGRTRGVIISLCRTPPLRVKSHTTPSRSSPIFSAAR